VKTVLIVEDSPTMRQLTGFALRRLPGLRILEAEDGASALEILDGNEVDLILLDINMPVMGGFRFLERLAARPEPHPPVVLVTTESNDEDMQRATELGVTTWIVKPVQAATLANTVGRILEGGPALISDSE